MKADAPVRKTGRDTVAFALKGDQTWWGYTLAMFDKSIKGWWQRKGSYACVRLLLTDLHQIRTQLLHGSLRIGQGKIYHLAKPNC